MCQRPARAHIPIEISDRGSNKHSPTTPVCVAAPPINGVHSIDDELAALASQFESHVVTRNSHRSEIELFLKARSLSVEAVHVVTKGTSKAAAMLKVCRALAAPCRDDGPRGLLVDDSVAEVCDEAVAALPSLVRVLFRRGVAG